MTLRIIVKTFEFSVKPKIILLENSPFKVPSSDSSIGRRFSISINGI